MSSSNGMECWSTTILQDKPTFLGSHDGYGITCEFLTNLFLDFHQRYFK